MIGCCHFQILIVLMVEAANDSVNGVMEYNTEKEVCYKWFDCLYKMDTHKEMWSLSGSERHSTIDKAFMWKELAIPRCYMISGFY